MNKLLIFLALIFSGCATDNCDLQKVDEFAFSKNCWKEVYFTDSFNVQRLDKEGCK